MNQPVPEWERPEWEPDLDVEPAEPNAGSPGLTRDEWLAMATPPRAEPDFQTRPIEPPYRRWKNLGKPYETTSRPDWNPGGLSERKLAALHRFFETRQV